MENMDDVDDVDEMENTEGTEDAQGTERGRGSDTAPDRSLADGVRAAFLAEAATAARYTYCAQVAGIEGHPEAARVFGELAESVACAAHGHLDVLRDLLGGDDPETGRVLGDPARALEDTGRALGDTRRNLAAAIGGDLGEATELYPGLAARAHRDGAADLASWLETLCALKKTHVDRLEQALTGLTEPTGPRFAGNGAP
ncbi:rubrerythrin family protein [Streptomyces sp. NPDC004610]|uniref:rubrerythrin family protein n=1 Tax=unclassified Streptomyces TaxID=2593676 RepID=UPI0033B47FC4